MTTRLGPNDLQPCGTPAARKRHAVQGVACHRCGVEGRPHVAGYVDRLEAERDAAEAEVERLNGQLATLQREHAETVQQFAVAIRETEQAQRRRDTAEKLLRMATAGREQQHDLNRAAHAADALNAILRHPVIRHEVVAYLACERSRL